MRILSLALSLSIAALPALAHEFWISPEKYMIEPQDQLRAAIRVGENFKGGASPFLPTQFERFDVVLGDSVRPVTGRVGDRPALANATLGDGLHVIVHQTTDSRLTYSDWSKFQNFVTHKDFAWALEQHAARGLPQTGFRELYSRYGKALIGVGSAAGEDVKVGLLTEIIARANPYTDDLSGGLPVDLLYKGQARADTQVELFERAPDGTVAVTLHRTDADGRAVLPVKPGHTYLVDAVVMRAVEPRQDRDPVWESLWASLTFQVPGQVPD